MFPPGYIVKKKLIQGLSILYATVLDRFTLRVSALTQSTIQNVAFLGVPCSPYSSLVISFVTDNKNSFNNQSFSGW